MPETETKIHPRDHFPPCLLSRLIDREPQIKKEHNPLMITAEQLRMDVLQNLEIIFNSRSRLSDAELAYSQEMTTSVLGFGLSDFCGISRNSDAAEHLQIAIARQIQCFEPRILKESLEVSIIPAEGNAKELEFQISGIIMVAPLKEEILFTSKLDLETGGVAISTKKTRREHE